MDKQDNTLKTSCLKNGFNESLLLKENILKGRGRKRKRLKSESDSDSESALPDNTLEFEKNLHASALKNNLDDISVKKILKKVVTNDHVLALVKLREEEENSNNEHPGVEPKRTRSKTKELMKVDPDHSLWPIELSPIKEIPVKTRPEVKALIAQELPEDEDDEEYKPTHDDVPSDDDQTLESCSDVDSQPRTPATPHQTASPSVVKDGPFKVPQDTPARRKLVIEEEEATIALRTRSKLSLSHTPIEHIESSFVPPDDIPTPAVDDLWSEFLNDVLNPASVTRHEDDDEADPEYNVAADPDAKEEDEDGLERILKISKKELSDLMTELLHVMPEPEDITEVLNDQGPQNQISNRWEGKQEPLSDNENEGQASVLTEKRTFSYSIGKTEIEDPDYEGETNTTEVNGDREIRTEKENGNVTNSQTSVDISIEEQTHSVQPAPPSQAAPPPSLRHLADGTSRTNTMYITVDDGVHFLPEQIQLLQQQLRQHIQLATSNFLQLYVNPTHWAMAPPYKEYLKQLHKIYLNNPKSVVNVCNLVSAVELVDSWEKSVSDDTPENKEMIEFMQNQEERSRRRYANFHKYTGDFPEIFKQVIANSTVFLYPYLLPPRPYRVDSAKRFGYRLCEDELIALGLEQFWQYVYDNPQVYKPPKKLRANCRWGMTHTLELICKHMLPAMPPRNLALHIHKCRKDKENPITKFFERDTVEPMKHKLLPFGPNLTLYEQPEHEMPHIWVRYLAKSSKRFRNHLFKGKCSGMPPADGVTINMGEIIGTPQKTPLPIDFTKTIVCNRRNVNRFEKVPVEIPDKYDVELVRNNANVSQSNNIVVGNAGANVASHIATSNGNIVGNLIPVNTLRTPERNQSVNRANNIPLTSQAIPNNIMPPSGNMILPQSPNANNLVSAPQNTGKYQIVVSNGNILLPLTPNTNNTTTSQNEKMNSANPRCILLQIIPRSNDVPGLNEKQQISEQNETKQITEKQIDKKLKYHCKCCLILKRINNQKKITDFFKRKDDYDEHKSNTCDCNNRSYSKISKRLKLLISNFKLKSWSVYKELENKIIKNKDTSDVYREEDYDLDDIATVTSYQMKLAMRTGICRDYSIKSKIFKCLSKFDLYSDDPLKLTDLLYKHFDVALVDLYKEFIMFLTPYQAEKIKKFKDYFVLCIVDGLVKKIEKEIKDKDRQIEILSLIKDMSCDSASTSCEMCTSLLNKMFGYPQLAAYVFEQFPHKNREMGEKDRHIIGCEVAPPGSKETTLESENASSLRPAETQPAEEMEQDNVEQPLVIDDSSSHIADKMASPCSEDYSVVEPKQENGEGSPVIDYAADNSSSDNEDSQKSSPPVSPQQNHKPKTEPDFHHSFEDSNNVIDTPELTISKTEVQDYDSTTDMSMLVMSEDELTIKSEAPEWTREEDKHILETLMEHLSPEDRQDKSVLEIIQESNIYQMLSESLTDKSINDIRDRVTYLLSVISIFGKYIDT